MVKICLAIFEKYPPPHKETQKLNFFFKYGLTVAGLQVLFLHV